MKVKTWSGIEQFQQDKKTESWFGKSLPILSSIDICQPQQAIEPGRNLLKLMEKMLILKKAMTMMFVKKRQVKALPQGPLIGHQIQKENMYLQQRETMNKPPQNKHCPRILSLKKN